MSEATTYYHMETLVEDGQFMGLSVELDDGAEYRFRLTKGWRWHPMISRDDLAARMGVTVEYLLGLERVARVGGDIAREIANHVQTLDQAEIDKRLRAFAEYHAFSRKKNLEVWGYFDRAEADDVPPALADVGPVRRLNPVHPCIVYFLLRQGEVVYVGQTSSAWPERIATHLNEGTKDFDDVWYLEVERRELSAVEAFYIRHFQPEYNTHFIGSQG